MLWLKVNDVLVNANYVIGLQQVGAAVYVYIREMDAEVLSFGMEEEAREFFSRLMGYLQVANKGVIDLGAIKNKCVVL